ncbi:MAG TPA: O-antigen ligase family protein [Mycobacteriales bacterium]|nr:O-antigen ligase family protein [Mycobacteriales bacterium]
MVLLMCGWWLLVAPRLWGGREAGAVTGGVILTGLSILAIQPQRWVPRSAVWSAGAISVGAFGVALFAPTGWAGATTAASYVGAAWTVIAVAAAVVRDRRFVDFLALLLVAGVQVEVAESWLAWWGGGDPRQPIVGTFYWHDPFAAFLLPGTVVGLALWLRKRRATALFGLVGLVLGSIGLVYSTSRASDACFAAAVVLVGAMAARGGGLAAIRRFALAVLVAVAGIFAVAGPPFFPHRSLPFAGTAARAGGQSLGQNGGYRIDFWREALGVFGRHPLVGGGYHSLASESVGHDPSGWPLSPLAHNGYLQALSDGGLLLAVPFGIAVVALSWWTLSALLRAVRRRDDSVARFVLPLCLGAMLLHSAVDFDWSYAADFALAAVLAGAVAGQRWADRGPAPARASRARRSVVMAGVALCAVAAVAAWSGDLTQSLPIAHNNHLSGGRS